MEVSELVDHDLIAVAEQRHAAAADRLSRSGTDLLAAMNAHKTAKAVSRQAVAGDGDPHAAEAALEAAERAVRVAKKVQDSATAEHDLAILNKSNQVGLAWVAVYLEGVRGRLAACRKADQARAMLAEADVDHTAATELLRQAFAKGVPHLHGAQDAPRRLGTEAEERGIWESRGVHADTGQYPWDPGQI